VNSGGHPERIEQTGFFRSGGIFRNAGILVLTGLALAELFSQE